MKDDLAQYERKRSRRESKIELNEKTRELSRIKRLKTQLKRKVRSSLMGIKDSSSEDTISKKVDTIMRCAKKLPKVIMAIRFKKKEIKLFKKFSRRSGA